MYERLTRLLLRSAGGFSDEIGPGFVHEINRLVTDHPELGLVWYQEILDRNGVGWLDDGDDRAMEDTDISELDGQAVAAMLVYIQRADYYASQAWDGELDKYIRTSCVKRCLFRLKEIDDERMEHIMPDKASSTDFEASLRDFASRAFAKAPACADEEKTKHFLILPFFRLLGYDVFDPEEIVPEYAADAPGLKKGEKVDYAIMRSGMPAVIVEAKAAGTPLDGHTSQLFRYFAAVRPRLAVLTDGIEYRFYSDLDDRNVMDEEPFLTVDLEHLDDRSVSWLESFRKSAFDPRKISDAAFGLKWGAVFSDRLEAELDRPSDDLIRLCLGPERSGRASQAFLDRLRPAMKAALEAFRMRGEFDECPPHVPPAVLSDDARVWGIHGKDDALFLEGGLIAIGWEEFGDLSGMPDDKAAFQGKYVSAYPDATKQSAAACAGMLRRFRHEAGIGDGVVFRSKADGLVHVGIVEGDYSYEASAAAWRNRRKVRWLAHVPADTFSKDALHELGSAMTFFMIRNHAAEFLAVAGIKVPDADVSGCGDAIARSGDSA